MLKEEYSGRSLVEVWEKCFNIIYGWEHFLRIVNADALFVFSEKAVQISTIRSIDFQGFEP